MQSAGREGGIEVRERESRVFPEEGKEEVIISMALTQDFLIYATQVLYVQCIYSHDHVYKYVRVHCIYKWLYINLIYVHP